MAALNRETEDEMSEDQPGAGKAPTKKEIDEAFRKGFEEGVSKASAEAADYAAKAAESAKSDLDAAYRQGVDDTLARLRPPLFEAAKRLCDENWQQPDKVLLDEIARLEGEYEQHLSASDRQLALAVARRRRTQRSEQNQLARDLGLARPPTGRGVVVHDEITVT